MFSFILDFLFPKRCVSCGKIGEYICGDCLGKIQFVQNQICPVCQRPSITGATHYRCSTKLSLDGQISAANYLGPVRAAIHKLKYRWVFDIANDLVALINSKINLKKFFPDKKFLLLPIPLHPKRQADRGFNQSEKLAKVLGKILDFKLADKVLTRTKHTKPQTNLPAVERRKNVAGVFKVTDTKKVKGKNFILVDDLVTTGSTLKSAGVALKRAGAASVWGLTFARTQRNNSQ